VSEEGQLDRERILPRTISTPNPSINTRKPISSSHTALRVRRAQLTPQLVVEVKHDDHNFSNIAPLLTSEKHLKIGMEDAKPLSKNSSFSIQGSGVLNLIPRLSSHLNSRPFNTLDDEDVLSTFNMEVGTVASRVDMWRQRLDDERTESVRSQSRSTDIGSSPPLTPANQVHSFIAEEIHDLIQLIKDLTNSLSGSFTWGILGIEDKLMALLDRGSHMGFPLADFLVINIWHLLRAILDLREDDAGKGGRMNSVVGAINHAFYAIRSLINLGKAYSNGHESSDSEYTAEDLRSLLARSITNSDIKPKEDNQ